MKPQVTRYWPVVLTGLTLVLLGIWTIYKEAAPNLRGGRTAIARLANMPDGYAPIGLTVLSQHSALLDCEQLFRSSQSLEIQYLQPAERDRLVEICGQMANAILSRTPVDSFAWLTQALANARQGDFTKYDKALLRSQMSGPEEGWLSNMRIQVAEAYFDDLSGDTRAGYYHDLGVAAAISEYAPILATRFVGDENFRTRMQKALEAMKPSDQRRFLAMVREILTATGQ